jgi:hypothetical protein
LPTPATTRTCATASTGSRKSRPEGRLLVRRLIYIAFFIEVGLLLIVLPWSRFWERNYFAIGAPGVYAFITNNFVRGGVSGLGLVNLIAGLAEFARLVGARQRWRVDDGPDGSGA